MKFHTCLIASIDHLLMPVGMCAAEGIFSVSCPDQSFSQEASGEELVNNCKLPLCLYSSSKDEHEFAKYINGRNLFKVDLMASIRLIKSHGVVGSDF